MDKKLTSVIRSLAAQVVEAKVIADRLGIKSNALFASKSADVAIDPTDGDASLAPKPTAEQSGIGDLQITIQRLNDTIMELRSLLGDTGAAHEFTDLEVQRILQSVQRSFAGLGRGQITGYYNKEFFQTCGRSLRPIVAKALVLEFESRNLEPMELWTTHLH